MNCHNTEQPPIDLSQEIPAWAKNLGFGEDGWDSEEESHIGEVDLDVCEVDLDISDDALTSAIHAAADDAEAVHVCLGKWPGWL